MHAVETVVSDHALKIKLKPFGLFLNYFNIGTIGKYFI